MVLRCGPIAIILLVSSRFLAIAGESPTATEFTTSGRIHQIRFDEEIGTYRLMGFLPNGKIDLTFNGGSIAGKTLGTGRVLLQDLAVSENGIVYVVGKDVRLPPNYRKLVMQPDFLVKSRKATNRLFVASFLPNGKPNLAFSPKNGELTLDIKYSIEDHMQSRLSVDPRSGELGIITMRAPIENILGDSNFGEVGDLQLRDLDCPVEVWRIGAKGEPRGFGIVESADLESAFSDGEFRYTDIALKPQFLEGGNLSFGVTTTIRAMRYDLNAWNEDESGPDSLDEIVRLRENAITKSMVFNLVTLLPNGSVADTTSVEIPIDTEQMALSSKKNTIYIATGNDTDPFVAIARHNILSGEVDPSFPPIELELVPGSTYYEFLSTPDRSSEVQVLYGPTTESGSLTLLPLDFSPKRKVSFPGILRRQRIREYLGACKRLLRNIGIPRT